MTITNYEEVSVYPLDAEMQERLLATHNECSFVWSTRDGWPVGVIMSYVWRDGRIWLTASEQRKRIAAVRRDARVCVIVTSTGSALGPGKTVTIKGRCAVHMDAETRQWFYPALAASLIPNNPRRQAGFVAMLDSPRRVILEVTPEQYISYDGAKMAADSGGALGGSPPRGAAPEQA